MAHQIRFLQIGPRRKSNRLWASMRLVALLVSPCIQSLAQPMTARQLDQLIQRNQTLFHLPGVALAIIKDGKLIVSKAYGLRSLRTKQPVTPQTLFGIASLCSQPR